MLGHYLIEDEKAHKKFDDIPYTGEIKTPNGKDKFSMITFYQNGLPHGLHKRFFLNGSLMETGTHKKGNRTGERNGYYTDCSVDPTITKLYE